VDKIENSQTQKAETTEKKRYVSPKLIKNEPIANVTFGATGTGTGTTLPGTAGSPGSVV